MSDNLLEDLALFDSGELNEEALRGRHPDESFDGILGLHHSLTALGADGPTTPQWRDVVGHLDDPAPRWGRRRLVGVLVGTLILVPAAAEALEEIAPDQVRDTFVDRITDVLPWDRPLPPSDRRPVTDEAPLTDQLPVTDGAPLTEEAPVSDQVPGTDQAPVSDGTPVSDEIPATDQTPATDAASETDGAPVVDNDAATDQMSPVDESTDDPPATAPTDSDGAPSDQDE